MALEDFLPRIALPSLTQAEREAACILIVESDMSIRNTMRQTLTSLGYPFTCDAPNHALALQKLAERPVTHVIFEAKKTNMPASEFLTAVLACDEKIIAIPSSYEPSVDDVFNLFIVGARGYIVKPFNSDSLEQAILMASKGEPMSEAILYAKDRNEALVSLSMTALDKLCLTMRQSQHFETAKRELPKRIMNFKRALEVSKTFALNGKPGFIEAMLEFCIERSNGPASRIGRIRKRKTERKGPQKKKNAETESLENKADGSLDHRQGSDSPVNDI